MISHLQSVTSCVIWIAGIDWPVALGNEAFVDRLQVLADELRFYGARLALVWGTRPFKGFVVARFTVARSTLGGNWFRASEYFGHRPIRRQLAKVGRGENVACRFLFSPHEDHANAREDPPVVAHLYRCCRIIWWKFLNPRLRGGRP